MLPIASAASVRELKTNVGSSFIDCLACLVEAQFRQSASILETDVCRYKCQNTMQQAVAIANTVYVTHCKYYVGSNQAVIIAC